MADPNAADQDIPIALDFLPGITRDGTRFDANTYLDGQWCRFRKGRPRKIGGYFNAYGGLAGTPRKVHEYFQGDQLIVHVGTTNGIQQVILDSNGNLISSTDRTPTIFAGGANVGWTLDSI